MELFKKPNPVGFPERETERSSRILAWFQTAVAFLSQVSPRLFLSSIHS